MTNKGHKQLQALHSAPSGSIPKTINLASADRGDAFLLEFNKTVVLMSTHPRCLMLRLDAALVVRQLNYRSVLVCCTRGHRHWQTTLCPINETLCSAASVLTGRYDSTCASGPFASIPSFAGRPDSEWGVGSSFVPSLTVFPSRASQHLPNHRHGCSLLTQITDRRAVTKSQIRASADQRGVCLPVFGAWGGHAACLMARRLCSLDDR